MKKFGLLLSITLTMYFASGLFLYLFQSNFLYFPTAKATHTFKVEKFSIKEATLNVIVLHPNKDKAILYFGGNSESVAKTAAKYQNLLPAYTVYFMNYRGYGGSTGQPTEKNNYNDARYIYDKIVSRHQQISVIGRSLGTGVATQLAATRTINKMILITPYDSIQNIAQSQYPIFPMSILLTDKYDSASRVKDIKARTLIILAELDTLIPLKSSEQLIKKFPPSQVTVATIKKANHNTVSHQQRYYSLITEFL